MIRDREVIGSMPGIMIDELLDESPSPTVES